jgi:hypothetical protein
MKRAWVLLAVAGLPALAHAQDGLAVVSARRVPIAADVVVEQEMFTLRGIPMRRAWRTTKVEATGARRIVAGVSPNEAPQVDPNDAVIDRDALPELVRDALALTDTPSFERPAELVYLLVLGHPVLAWEVQLPLTTRPEPSRKTVWISAMTGRFLDEVEQVRSARARVFAENPSKTPEPIEVELRTLANAEPGAPLESEVLISWNCVDEAPAELPEWNFDEDECFPQHLALADENGDFFVPLPDVIDEADGVRPSDRYSELSMYFHAERFLDGLAERGVYEFQCVPATLQANKRRTTPQDELPFTPLNNAYYTNQCDPNVGPTMIFGQGTEVDFAYDGDVVYHELGHGVVALLAPEGLSGVRERPDAAVVDAGSINEGLADYFAFMITDDPRLAEYVGRFWSSNSGDDIRDGENERRCPEDSIGEVHADGEPVQAALWATRSRLDGDAIPSQRIALDKIVLATLTRLPQNATFEELSAALLEEAEASDELGAFGYEVLERSLRTRGLVDCPRVIEDPEAVVAGRTMYLRKRTPNVHPFYPGPMQLGYVVPEGVDAVDIVFTLRNRAEDGLGAAVLVKWGGAIAFDYALGELDDPGDATGQSGRIREVTLVRGDWDLELHGEEVEPDTFVVPLRNLAAGQALHVSLASLSTNDLTASSVRIVPSPYIPPSEATGSTGDDGEVPAEGDDAVHARGAVAGGCGCRSGAPSSAWILVVLACLRARRGSASCGEGRRGPPSSLGRGRA